MKRGTAAALNGLLLTMSILALSGCERKAQLYLAADVRKASEIEAVLGGDGIDVERKTQKTGVMLYVADSEIARAMRALHEAGLLRPNRPSVDEALGKRGIAPTPLEERARRVHAIERDLEATLMEIDGVTAARVRVVPPERPSAGAPLAPASASVLLKHRAGVDLSPLMPGIARLVKNGAPGLAGEDDRRVTVLLVPEQPAAPARVIAQGATGGSAPWVIAVVCLSIALGCLADQLRRRVTRPRLGEPRSNAARQPQREREGQGQTEEQAGTQTEEQSDTQSVAIRTEKSGSQHANAQ